MSQWFLIFILHILIKFQTDYTQETREDSIRSLSRTKERSPFLSRKRNSDILRIPPIKPESTASRHQEIRCIEPEDAKIIHLVKEPLKYKEEKTESLDILKTYPEKPVVVLEDEDFERKEDNKVCRFKFHSTSPTKYNFVDEFKRSVIDMNISTSLL